MKLALRALLFLAIAVLIAESINLINFKKTISTTQTLSLVFSSAFPSQELVVAKGYYGVMVKKEQKSPPIYLEGIVRVGIDLNELKFEEKQGMVFIFYPPPRLLGVDLTRHINFSEKLDKEFYNQTLRTANFYLFQQAKKEGILRQAEARLKKELFQLAQALFIDKKINIYPKLKRKKIERE